MNTAIASYEPAEALLTRIDGTDVWYRSYPARNDARFSYELSVNDNLVPFDQVTDWGARSATFHRDPFNKRVHESGFGREVSVAEGPRAPRDEWSDARAGVATGRVEQTSVKSELLGTTRDVWVYTPAGYDTLARKGGLPVLLIFDGGEYVKSIHVPTILDNLVAARRIAPMIAVFVGSADEQRDVELNQNERYAQFLATELLPCDPGEVRHRVVTRAQRRRRLEHGRPRGGVRRQPSSRVVRQRALAVGRVHVRRAGRAGGRADEARSRSGAEARRRVLPRGGDLRDRPARERCRSALVQPAPARCAAWRRAIA